MALSPAHSPRCPVASGPVLMAELFGTARASLEKVQLSGPQARAAATRVKRSVVRHRNQVFVELILYQEPRLDTLLSRTVARKPHVLRNYSAICCTYFLPVDSSDGTCMLSNFLFPRHRRKTSGLIFGHWYRSLEATISNQDDGKLPVIVTHLFEPLLVGQKGMKLDLRKNSPQFRQNPRSYNFSSGSTGAIILSPPRNVPGMHT